MSSLKVKQKLKKRFFELCSVQDSAKKISCSVLKRKITWFIYENVTVQYSSVCLFAIENYMNRSKKKSNHLDSRGEEAQKKLAGL